MLFKIIVNGATGRMGQETVKALAAVDDLTCVATPTRYDDLRQTIMAHQPDIVIDFTTADVVYENTKTIIDMGVHPVIGSTGLTTQQITTLTEACDNNKLGGIIAPNFSIGAILMMKYAKDAARYFKQAEIIEMHHDKKLDAPSGTAIKTAELIAKGRETSNTILPESKEILPGSRGAKVCGVPIHAVRLPSLLAHQKVIMGEHDQIFEIRHDSLHRRSFMPGVLLACRHVVSLKRLVYGLENLV